jgi:hypothetical protein
VVSLQQQLTAAAQAAAQQEKEDTLSTVTAEHAATMAQLSTSCAGTSTSCTQHSMSCRLFGLSWNWLLIMQPSLSSSLDMSKQQLCAAQQEAGAACARVADLERMLFVKPSGGATLAPGSSWARVLGCP